MPGDQQAEVGRIPVRYGASDSPLEKRFVPNLLWHILDKTLPGLPGLWTLRIGIGNLICRPTPVAYNRAKQWQALSGRNEEKHFSYVEFFSDWADVTIARTFAGRAHRAPYFSFAPQIICGTIGDRRPACGLSRRQRQSVARCGRRWQGGGFRLLQRSHLLLVAYASVHRPWSRNTRVLRQGHERRVPSAQVEPGMIRCSEKGREHSE